MHIAVEGGRLLREKRGIGRYVRNLLREMPLLRPEVSFTVHSRSASDEPALRTLLESIGATAGRARLARVSDIPHSDADLVWYPWNWINSQAERAAMVVTIHDIVPMIRLDHRWWKVYKRFKYRRRYTHSLHVADAVLADSAFTAQELARVLKPDMSKVHEVLLAANDFIPDAADVAPVLDRIGVTGQFFLMVGANDARKNLPVALRAMQVLVARGETATLVLCGPGVRLSSAAAAESAAWLKYAGFVSDTELAALYRRATALVFPSRYEGFGLPVLEAMACGGRVVCADASSLPQVAGDAALLFPPDDHVALADQLTRLLHDADLRDALTARGLQRATQFAWTETARQTLAVFDIALTRRTARR
jgi:glycosyltransferase involved in cell wall biosynthesis